MPFASPAFLLVLGMGEFNMFRKIIFIIILGLVSSKMIHSQTSTFRQYAKIDKHVKKTPDSLSNNIISLHNYLVSAAQNDQEKIRAFYMWIITNIKYEDQQELMYDPDLLFYMGSNNCASPVCVLNKRKAVCEGFSKLFQFFCQQSGLEAYSIGGYISKNGAFQDRATHSWNAVKINDTWRFFDLSWANAILHHTGIKSETNEFFMVPPEEFILSHLPLISMWQFLETPVPLRVFNSGKDRIKRHLNAAPAIYNFNDSLQHYNGLSAEVRRLKTAEEIYKTNPSNKFNLAVEYYRYARVILNFEGEIDAITYYKLLKARKKITEAINIFRSTPDISSQIMLLQAQDDLYIIQRFIKRASSDIIHLK